MLAKKMSAAMPAPAGKKGIPTNLSSRLKPELPGQMTLTGMPRFGEIFAGPSGPNTSSGGSRKQNLDDTLHEFKYDSYEEQQAMHMNVLFILDDVVADVKKREAEADLASLFFNRRHLVSNGTVSIMLVTQKYTLIPSRLRSSANWLILYRLNPIDFDAVYKDVIILNQQLWKEVLDFVFKPNDISGTAAAAVGTEEESKGPQSTIQALKKKRFDNLGIWVEFDIYFKNFERIAYLSDSSGITTGGGGTAGSTAVIGMP